MIVKLLFNTPLWVASTAIRKCWASEDKSDSDRYFDYGGNECYYIGTKDKELIHRVGNKNKHSSTLEHLNYSFDIDGISRACLQELARHRHASMSVKSTRYTLKELKNEESFERPEGFNPWDIAKVEKYCVLPWSLDNDEATICNSICEELESLRFELNYSKLSNDVIKYMLPEAYKTSLVWTVNARSLQNFLKLRTDKSALWEIRKLAYEIYNNLPDEHKYLFSEFLYKEKE